MADKQFEIRLGVNSTSVATGINSAIGQVQRLQKSVTATVQGLGIYGIVKSGIDGLIKWGAEVQTSARTAGIGVEAFQEISAAAKETSTDVGDAATAFKKLQLAQVAAIKGNDESAKAFQRAGLSIAHLKTLTPQQLWEEVGAAFEKMAPSAQATADAITLMGKAGDRMAGAFRAGFIGAQKDARQLGEVLTEDVVKSLVRADDAMTRFALQAKVAIASMLPPLIELTAQILDGAQATILWLQTWFSVKGTRAQAANEANKAVDEFFNAKTRLAQQTAKYQNPKAGKPTDASNVTPSGNANPLAKPDSDRLLNIGGYRGGAEIARIPAQQLQVQQRMEQHLGRIAHYVVDSNTQPTRKVDEVLTGLQDLVRSLTPLAYDLE